MSKFVEERDSSPPIHLVEETQPFYPLLQNFFSMSDIYLNFSFRKEGELSVGYSSTQHTPPKHYYLKQLNCPLIIRKLFVFEILTNSRVMTISSWYFLIRFAQTKIT